MAYNNHLFLLENDSWEHFMLVWILHTYTNTYCQPMVIDTNSTPTEIPTLRFSEKGNLIQGKTAQLWCSLTVRQSWGQAALKLGLSLARQLCSAPSWETQSSVFGRKGTCALRARQELPYVDRSPSPWSLIGLSCKGGLQILTV